MISWVEFDKIDLWAGTIVKSEFSEGTRKPALKSWIDFDPNWGIKAQITRHYGGVELVGKQVITSTFIQTDC